MTVGRSSDPIERARENWVDNGLEGADFVIGMASLVRANQIVEARVDSALEPFGLNMLRYNALSTLRFSPEGRPMGRVAWGLMIHPATVTAVVDRLERDGLVERRPHPTDRRAVLVVITKRGLEVVEEATAVLLESKFGLDGLAPAEARSLTRSLMPIRRAAGDIKDRTSP